MSTDSIWMMPSAVADVFGVNAKTVSRWARDGLIKAERTPGGHRRYKREEVERVKAYIESQRAKGNTP